MKHLIAGRTGPLKVSSAKAVQALLRERVSSGSVEQPDVEPTSPVTNKVQVRVHVPKAAEFLVQRKRPNSSG